LAAPSTKFLKDELGIFELDAGKYQPTCGGVIPVRILSHIEKGDGASGANLLAKCGGPPYAYQTEAIKACVLGLLRGSKIKIEDSAGNEITAVRDAGVREVFDKPAAFRRSQNTPAATTTSAFAPARGSASSSTSSCTPRSIEKTTPLPTPSKSNSATWRLDCEKCSAVWTAFPASARRPSSWSDSMTPWSSAWRGFVKRSPPCSA
jgi:hypothetical protein